MKKILVLLACFTILLSACGKKKEKNEVAKVSCQPLLDEEIATLLQKVKEMPMEPVQANEVAVLETNHGKMVVSFFPDKAPMTCTAFKRLVKTGYYDCTRFHRIIAGFMAQGGDINSKDTIEGNEGQGGPGYSLPAEFNDTPHDKGVLSMARRGDDINSAGSQFFICLSRERTQRLDGQYTVFGKLIEGVQVLEKIGAVPVVLSENGEMAKPEQPVYITKAYMQIR